MAVVVAAAEVAGAVIVAVVPFANTSYACTANIVANTAPFERWVGHLRTHTREKVHIAAT